MASTTRVCQCRLCRTVVESKRAVSLFTAIGIQHEWAQRIERLLELPVDRSDSLPTYICTKCKQRIEALEKAAVDLKGFKDMAWCSKTALERVRCPLKRTKATSSDTGVSPDTQRERPKSKLTRKRLDFDSKIKSDKGPHTDV